MRSFAIDEPGSSVRALYATLVGGGNGKTDDDEYLHEEGGRFPKHSDHKELAGSCAGPKSLCPLP